MANIDCSLATNTDSALDTKSNIPTTDDDISMMTITGNLPSLSCEITHPKPIANLSQFINHRDVAAISIQKYSLHSGILASQHIVDGLMETFTRITLQSFPFSISSASLATPSLSKLVQQKSEDEVEELENNALNNAENLKFAAITAAVSDVLLDDETSPPISMMSSWDSEAKCKIAKRIINDSIKEKDLDDISPTFDVASPVSHGTPTHASHSFSLSDGDGGRDFLIDDEIADQPALCFGDDHGKSPLSLSLSLIERTNINYL